MLLKIYLIISVVTLICVILANLSMVNRAMNKYGDQIEEYKQEGKKDIPGIILAFLKVVIIAFIPIVNVLMLLRVIFLWDKVVAKCDANVENALEEAKKNAV